MKYFGTDGIRGVYGRTITEQLAFKIGLAAAYLCGEIIVARDTRVSGKSLSDALISGLVRGGRRRYRRYAHSGIIVFVSKKVDVRDNGNCFAQSAFL